MKPVIYADVLVFLNMIITFLLLLASSRLMRASPTPGRFAAGSLLGGFFSLIILAPDMGVFLSLAVKLVFSLIIIIVVYNPATLKNILRCTGYFFAVNFIFAGIMMFLSSLVSDEFIKMNNGAVYFNFSFLSLVASSVLCCVLTCVLNKITGRRRAANQELGVIIQNGGLSVRGTAAVDTGNSLRDPFTGESIIVADRDFVEKLIPRNVKAYMDGDTDSCRGIRLAPFSGVSSKGLLPCFRCEKIFVTGKNSEIVLNKPEIAVASEPLRNCSLLLPPEAIENNEGRKIKNAETVL